MRRKFAKTGAPTKPSLVGRLIAGACLLSLVASISARAQVTGPDDFGQSGSDGGDINGSIKAAPRAGSMFSYPVGLDANGDNWLAVRSMPSASEGGRLARIGPGTLFTEVGRIGGWVQVRLLSGDTGWVSARYVGYCRAAAFTPPELDQPVPPRPTVSQSCGELWYQRNAIYKTYGYCFRTARGINAFGNAGCQYDDVAEVPLPARQHDEVAEIQQQESYQGCFR